MTARRRKPHSHQSTSARSAETVVLEDFLLDCLEGVEPEVAERLLDESVIGMSPEEAFDGFLTAAEKILPSLKSPLDAEMWGSELLGMFRLMGVDPEAVDELVAQMIIPASEAAATPAALALLTVLSSLGGPEAARAAHAARQTLVASGIPAPAWAPQLGMPTVGRCWVYGDVFGEQESIFATFRYGRSEHVLSVLVDHSLGGGVKDSYVATQVKKLRRQIAEIASDDPTMLIEDVDATEAASKLRVALAAPPCPRAPDQIRDSNFSAALVRSRVACMSAGLVSPPDSSSGGRIAKLPAPSSSSPTAVAGDTNIWQLKVTLNRTKPPIWRRLEVPEDVGLDALHRVIQDAFGWWDSHMHVFETAVGSFGLPDRELGFMDERSVTLRDVAPQTGDRLIYTYDFGDDWEHVIVVEKFVGAASGTQYPRCTGGRRACPPEDCGGVRGYAEMLRAVTDTGHEEHEEVASWLEEMVPGGFDPAKFEVGKANARLAGAARHSIPWDCSAAG